MIGVRPESIQISEHNSPDVVVAKLIDQSIGIAGYRLIRARIGDQEVKLKSKKPVGVEIGGTIGLRFLREKLLLFADGKRVDFQI